MSDTLSAEELLHHLNVIAALVNERVGYSRAFLDSVRAEHFIPVRDGIGALASERIPTEVHEAMPEVVTLCGSTRFRDDFESEQRRLTLEGCIVISVGLFGHLEGLDIGTDSEPTEVKVMLDELHKRKIDLSDRIQVINVGGYIGSSTRSEIEYAEATGKTVTYAFTMWPPTITDDSDTAMAHEPAEWVPTHAIDALIRGEGR